MENNTRSILISPRRNIKDGKLHVGTGSLLNSSELGKKVNELRTRWPVSKQHMDKYETGRSTGPVTQLSESSVDYHAAKGEKQRLATLASEYGMGGGKTKRKAKRRTKRKTKRKAKRKVKRRRVKVTLCKKESFHKCKSKKYKRK